MARTPPKPDRVELEWLTVIPERPPTQRDPRWWWRGYYYVQRETRHVKVGRATREEAVRIAAEYVARGKGSLAAERDEQRADARPAFYTVKDVCELWLGHQLQRRDAEHPQISPRAYTAYQNSVRRLVSTKVAPTLAHVHAEDLTDARIEDYRLARMAPGQRATAPRTINDDVGVLRMAWKWGRRRGYVPRDSEIEVKPLDPVPVRPTRTPERDELLLLIPHLPPRYALLILLMHVTGARIGEIAHLEWADCDLAAGVLHVGRHTGASKTGERPVPIEPEIVSELRTWRDRPPERPPRGSPVPDDIRARWVLGVKPTTAISVVVSRRLPAACKAAGLDRFTSHGLRRLASDEMGREGIEPAVAAAVLGHSPEMMYRKYRRPTMEDRRRAVTRTRLAARLTQRES